MITLLLIATTVMVSINAMNNQSMKNKLMFNAYQIHYNKEWYRFLSNGLIHADWFHLGFNMFALYMFGSSVEQAYTAIFGATGIILFLLLYILGLIASSLYSYFKHKRNIHYNALGASGAVSSVIFSYIVLAPKAELMFIFLPIPIPAYLFGIIYLATEYYMSKRGQTNIGHDAHFWGAVFGIAYTAVIKPVLILRFINEIIG